MSLTFLQSSITGLIANNRELEKAMKEKIPFLQAAFLDRLFKGGFNTLAEIENALSSVE